MPRERALPLGEEPRAHGPGVDHGLRGAGDEDGVRVSVSLVTVIFATRAGATRMTFTEQVVMLDRHGDVGERRRGTELGLDNLEAELQRS